MELIHINDSDHRRFIVGNEPQIFHCHHYNTFLQRSIQDPDYIDSKPFLIGAAAEVSFAQLSVYFTENNLNEVNERKTFASDFFKLSGFGVIDFTDINRDGGKFETHSSHYSFAWTLKFGKSKKPVCFFMSGWAVGALSAIYDEQLGAYSVNELLCKACGNDKDVFEIKREAPNYSIYKSVGLGSLSKTHNCVTPPQNNVDYEGIYTALVGMPIHGDERGIISAFGVYLTRMYANYYNRISFELLKELERIAGDEGIDIAETLLVEAGHVCAFNTLGGIMLSTEWYALIKPMLKTKEDWVHGIVAAVNAFGWGRWQIKSLSESEAVFLIHDDYESCGYINMYGTAKRNISFLVKGGVAGIMDLIYIGHIENKPELTPAFYNTLFKGENSYKVESLSSKAMGDEFTSFRVYR